MQTAWGALAAGVRGPLALQASALEIYRTPLRALGLEASGGCFPYHNLLSRSSHHGHGARHTMRLGPQYRSSPPREPYRGPIGCSSKGLHKGVSLSAMTRRNSNLTHPQARQMSMRVVMWLLPASAEAKAHVHRLLQAVKTSPCPCQKRHFRYASITATLNQATGGGSGSGWIGGGGGGGSGGDGLSVSPPTLPGISGAAQTEDATEEVVILDVGGMSCGGCSASVKRILESQPNVISATVNLATETALVRITKNQSAEVAAKGKEVKVGEALAEHLTKCGFKSTVRDLSGADAGRLAPAALRKREERLQRLKESGQRLTVAWTLAAACLFGHAAHWLHAWLPNGMHWMHSAPFHMALSVACLAGPARQLIIDGFNSLIRGSPNMNTLVGLGAISSFAVSTVAILLPNLGWHAFFEEPVMLLAFVLLGRAVEERAKLQATSDMTELLSMIPTRARLILGSSPLDGDSTWSQGSGKPLAVKTVEVPTDTLTMGSAVLVLPGDRIPVDGIVTAGRTEVDESSLTGEPLPVAKMIGGEVSAGTINCNGTISVSAKRGGGETVLGDIVRMVEEAQAREAPVQRFADKVSGMFCYGVMGLSAATFVFWNTVGAGLWPAVLPAGGPLLLGLQMACNVMVIACPCALGLATPTAVLVGTSIGARRGLLVRGGDVLERVSAIDTVVFDKTGTLTSGRPAVTGVLATTEDPASPSTADRSQKLVDASQLGVLERELLSLAAAVERGTVHPVAKALVRAADGAGCESLAVRDGSFHQEPGSGAVAELASGQRVAVGTIEWVTRHGVQGVVPHVSGSDGQTVVYVSVDGKFAGAVTMRDEVRDGAARTIEGLQKMGLEVMMLSGDRKGAAEAVASSIGIPSNMVYGEVRPQGKAEFVKELQNKGRKVAMVGDGVNDSAALAQADVGVAMVGGVGAASEVASIVLMGDRITQVLDAVDLSRATFRKIQQNITWAFLYNLVGLPVAAGALLPYNNTMLTPSLCGALMGISSLGVMANSLLLQLEFHRPSPYFTSNSMPSSSPSAETAPLLGAQTSGSPWQQKISRNFSSASGSPPGSDTGSASAKVASLIPTDVVLDIQGEGEDLDKTRGAEPRSKFA